MLPVNDMVRPGILRPPTRTVQGSRLVPLRGRPTPVRPPNRHPQPSPLRGIRPATNQRPALIRYRTDRHAPRLPRRLGPVPPRTRTHLGGHPQPRPSPPHRGPRLHPWACPPLPPPPPPPPPLLQKQPPATPPPRTPPRSPPPPPHRTLLHR